jgi:hypothetical protein
MDMAVVLSIGGRYTRFVSYEKLIAEVRAQLDALDAQLDSQRTPYMKAQLRFAGHLLDDAEVALRHAAEAEEPGDKTLWITFANFSVTHAKQIRDTVQKAGEPGGLANLIEIGGWTRIFFANLC